MEFKKGDIVFLLPNVDIIRSDTGWKTPLLEMLSSYYLDIPFEVIEIASKNVRLHTNHPTFNDELTSHPSWRFKDGISAFLIPFTAVKLYEGKPKALFKLLNNY